MVIGYFSVAVRKIVFKLWLVIITVLSWENSSLVENLKIQIILKEVRIPSSMRAEIVLILFSITFLIVYKGTYSTIDALEISVR